MAVRWGGGLIPTSIPGPGSLSLPGPVLLQVLFTRVRLTSFPGEVPARRGVPGGLQSV